VALAWPAQVNADKFTYTATDSASGTFSYGLLNATANGDGSYNATSGYLIVISGANVGAYELIPNPSPPGIFFIPGFFVDDQLFPAANPTLDAAGLAFTGTGLWINIWNDGGGVP
jgi:hypothetical protein